jgi:hypothetical protein
MTNTFRSEDIRGLEALREKLVARRRSIVSKLADAPGDSISGETFSKIQGAIDAVDHAIIDEQELALQSGSQLGNGTESFRARAGAVR